MTPFERLHPALQHHSVNSLGWKDPFSSRQSTERQRAYARLLETQIYTPQLVVDGTHEMVGSRREEVLAALREAPHEAIAPVAFAADRHSVTIGPTAAAGSSGQVLLVRFIRKRTTPIGAGENARHTAEDSNAVDVCSLFHPAVARDRNADTGKVLMKSHGIDASLAQQIAKDVFQLWNKHMQGANLVSCPRPLEANRDDA